MSANGPHGSEPGSHPHGRSRHQSPLQPEDPPLLHSTVQHPGYLTLMTDPSLLNCHFLFGPGNLNLTKHPKCLWDSLRSLTWSLSSTS